MLPSETINSPYFPLWSKYRPVILQMMKGAATEPQQYQLFDHEFKAVSKRVGYSFLLEAFNGKAKNNINGAAIPRDLLLMLKQSKTAVELMSADTYEFRLDKKFMLKVNIKEKLVAVPESVAETASQE